MQRTYEVGHAACVRQGLTSSLANEEAQKRYRRHFAGTIRQFGVTYERSTPTRQLQTKWLIL